MKWLLLILLLPLAAAGTAEEPELSDPAGDGAGLQAADLTSAWIEEYDTGNRVLVGFDSLDAGRAFTALFHWSVLHPLDNSTVGKYGVRFSYNDASVQYESVRYGSDWVVTSSGFGGTIGNAIFANDIDLGTRGWNVLADFEVEVLDLTGAEADVGMGNRTLTTGGDYGGTLSKVAFGAVNATLQHTDADEGHLPVMEILGFGYARDGANTRLWYQVESLAVPDFANCDWGLWFYGYQGDESMRLYVTMDVEREAIASLYASATHTTTADRKIPVEVTIDPDQGLLQFDLLGVRWDAARDDFGSREIQCGQQRDDVAEPDIFGAVFGLNIEARDWIIWGIIATVVLGGAAVMLRRKE